jgi:hypothetical protein
MSYGGKSAECIGFEPMLPFNGEDGLANRCLRPLGQHSIYWCLSLDSNLVLVLSICTSHRTDRGIGGSGEIRTHDPLPDDDFQDRCLKPDSATLPLIWQLIELPKLCKFFKNETRSIHCFSIMSSGCCKKTTKNP